MLRCLCAVTVVCIVCDGRCSSSQVFWIRCLSPSLPGHRGQRRRRMPSTSALWQTSKVSATPTATKFSIVRKLPTAAQSRSPLAAAPTRSNEPRQLPLINFDVGTTINTVNALHKEQHRVCEEDVTDKRISRYHYAQFVARLNEQRSIYQSTAVFVEAMLRELHHTAEASIAMKASAATWGLKLLAKHIGHNAINTVLESLLPAIYCEYDPEKLCRAPPAVQLQVGRQDVLMDNPYFTHSMFVDEVQVDKRSATKLQKSLEAALRANDERRNTVCRIIERQRHRKLEVAFRCWRHHVRQQRLLRMMGNNTAKQWADEMMRLRIQTIFYQWKLLVERSRSTYLTERLHDAAFQLENAKNQFQLQCYRADRLVQTVKETTDDMGRVSKINEELQRQVQELKEEQVRKEKEYQEKLTRNVAEAMKLLETYDSLARVLLHSKQADEYFMPEKTSEKENEELQVNAVTEASWELPSDPALQLLRQWCDGVLAQVSDRKEPFKPIGSFGADFSNGERYLYIFQRVFPEVVPTVLQIHGMDVESRLRRIRGYTADCGLRYRLVPSDFLNKREDLLVCSLSELYQKHMLRKWDQMVGRSVAELEAVREGGMKATLFGYTSPSPTDDVADTPAKQLDEAMVRSHITDYAERLKTMSEELRKSLAVENEVVKASSTIAVQEARLGGERLQGTPIPLVDEADRCAFWKLPDGALDDLRGAQKFDSEEQMWNVIVTQALPEVLQAHVDTTSRIFFLFAGDNARSLSEVAFWRFVECSGMLVGTMEVPMDWVAKQYDHVVTPQLDTALKAVARNQSEMSVQKLRQVAYQEMDIRSATPQQFVELLVRLAMVSENGQYGLVEGTRRLLQGIPQIGKEMSSVACKLHEPEMQHVLSFFNEDLLRVYLFYIRKQESSRNAQDVLMATQCGGRFASKMSITMFLTMLEDCRFLLDGKGGLISSVGISVDSTRQFFISAAQVRKVVSTLGSLCKSTMSGGLSFNLFVDTLAVLAHHWCPDPLVPEPRRLAGFLAHTVQQLSARHISSTLLLGSVPTIRLEGPKNVDFSHEASPSVGPVV
ncbi:hypothetical protein, conserved [Leishmania tarentolae]|uniref:Calponin-homology (CH) domain-containing protein n=1 Tax=Leishmania tarentolae TaxID=5689 RepID=A0A640KBT4_LEITA|nr:hypothetical protein, conserved [Leishmania tarentolae]